MSSCDSYLDIQPVGKVIPNTLSEYRALLTTAYNKGAKIIDKGVIDFRSDMAIVSTSSTAQNAYSDIENGMILHLVAPLENFNGNLSILSYTMPMQSLTNRIK